jgi:hypothetical protein
MEAQVSIYICINTYIHRDGVRDSALVTPPPLCVYMLPSKTPAFRRLITCAVFPIVDSDAELSLFSRYHRNCSSSCHRRDFKRVQTYCISVHHLNEHTSLYFKHYEAKWDRTSCLLLHQLVLGYKPGKGRFYDFLLFYARVPKTCREHVLSFAYCEGAVVVAHGGRYELF